MYINESGLYCLMLRSNQPRAKSFKRWITSEVLPSIRSCGSQLTNQYTAMNERLEKQEQTLSGQRQLLVDLEQRLLGSCSLAVAGVNGRLKDQDEMLSAQGQLLVNYGERLSRIHDDMRERLERREQTLSGQ